MNDETQPVETPMPRAPVVDPRPWPRYFARVHDTLILSMLMMAVLIFPAVFIAPDATDRLVALLDTGIGGTILSNVLGFALVPLPMGLLLARGQTPGKWLFGIRVRNADGSRMGVWKALKREGWVLVRGVGFGFPVVNLFTQIMSFSDLKDDGSTAWDRALGCSVQHVPATPLWWIRATLGAALVLAVMGWGYIDMVASAMRS